MKTAAALVRKDDFGFFIQYAHDNHKAGFANHVKVLNEVKNPKSPVIRMAIPSPLSPVLRLVSKHGCVTASMYMVMLVPIIIFETAVPLKAIQ
ncbi:hypothetical protein AAFN85_18450 [Mucilaginibacter sp. CAU 1740]|uniref:hypothetical protein n=1 Tax=Mucilaginibacter sp. CAU 1740 TaxID=3140365 RepID=UPI00325BDA33